MNQIHKRRFCLAVALAGCALAGHVLWRNHAGHVAQAQGNLPRTLPFDPGNYTITLIDFMNCQGTLRGTPATKVTFASRSEDQAFVELRQSLIANTTQGKLYVPASGLRADIFEHPKAGKGKSTLPFQGRQTLDPRTGCLTWLSGSPLRQGQRVVGREPIMRYETVHIVQDSGTRVWETWVAPQLGCALLRQEVTFKENGKYSKNIMELQSIKTGPPDPSLFDLSGHTEGSPLDHLKAAMKANGKTDAEIARDTANQPALQKFHDWYLQQKSAQK
jgi:hypothetical protein